MRKLSLILPAGLALLLLAGCQTWNPGGSTYTDKKNRFSVGTPAGWQYSTVMPKTDLLASKDGPVLQQLVVEHRPLDKALPNAKRPLAAGLDAFQLAEALIGDLRLDRELLALEVKENAPAQLGGRDACKVTYAYETSERLRLAETFYACVVGEELWLVRFTAPARHYFDRDRPAFEDLVRTFQFGDAAGGKEGK